MKKNIFSLPAIMLLLLACGITVNSFAQVKVFGSGYFQNRYLFNPAYAGQKPKLANIGAGYNKQGDGDKAPVTMYLNGDYGFNNMGVGVNIMNDKAGLLNTFKAMATYAYHLKFNDNEEADHGLSLGISAGGVQRRIDFTAITGDPDDQTLYLYNNQDMKFEADFGATYYNKGLTVQAALPNMVATFKNDAADIVNRPTLFLSASYKYQPAGMEGFAFEPLVAYRGLRNMDDIIDAGINISALNERVNVYGLYHSSKNISVGAGVKLSSFAHILLSYATQPSALKAYTSGNMEAAVRFSF
ncbi:PorP/SprF family type IX secretion system membrane protein [Terrimonas rubra]|uniref:PorP/SprF family type IX secretion system membrane protein n=1 Tax=Terrimonas rubra TaxID=1035890 RepID=A0ABW6AAM9_9BACT